MLGERRLGRRDPALGGARGQASVLGRSAAADGGNDRGRLPIVAARAPRLAEAVAQRDLPRTRARSGEKASGRGPGERASVRARGRQALGERRARLPARARGVRGSRRGRRRRCPRRRDGAPVLSDRLGGRPRRGDCVHGVPGAPCRPRARAGRAGATTRQLRARTGAAVRRARTRLAGALLAGRAVGPRLPRRTGARRGRVAGARATRDGRNGECRAARRPHARCCRGRRGRRRTARGRASLRPGARTAARPRGRRECRDGRPRADQRRSGRCSHWWRSRSRRSQRRCRTPERRGGLPVSVQGCSQPHSSSLRPGLPFPSCSPRGSWWADWRSSPSIRLVFRGHDSPTA